MWDYIFYMLVHFRFGDNRPKRNEVVHPKINKQETSMAKIKTVGDLMNILDKYHEDTPIAIYSSYNSFEIENVIDNGSCAILNCGKTNNSLMEEKNKRA